MAFDYSKLRGRIVEICGTQGEFAKRMNMSDRTLSLKMNGIRFWYQPEIKKACEVLRIDEIDIPLYFFAPKV